MGYYKEQYTLRKFDKKKPTKTPTQSSSGKFPTLEEKKEEEIRKYQQYLRSRAGNYKSIYTHPTIIKYFIDNNKLSTLAFYYKLKQHYKNSIVQRWNPNRISKRCSVSHYVASTYSKKLVNEGLACWETTKKGTHLRLKSMRQIYFLTTDRTDHEIGWVEIPVTYKSRINNIKDYLRNVLTYKLVKGQRYLSQLKLDNLKLARSESGEIEENPDGLNEAKIRKILKVRQRNPENLGNSVLMGSVVGMRRLGHIIGLSHYGASKFLSRLRKEGKIKTSVCYRFVKKVEGLTKPEEYAEVFSDYPGWFYRTRMGKIGVIFGTEINYSTTQDYPRQPS
jgi:hypothetical protein